MSLPIALKPTLKPITGVVIQAGAQLRTIKVLRSTLVLHPVVPKAIKKNVVYVVHDEKHRARRGDQVEITPEGRRISPNKTYTLTRILDRRRFTTVTSTKPFFDKSFFCC